MAASADSSRASLTSKSGWRVLTASERGAAHEVNGLPNQDAVAVAEAPGGGVIAAVADGHGHSRHIRSARGSRIAASVACEAGLELAALIAARGQAGATVVVSPSGPSADGPAPADAPTRPVPQAVATGLLASLTREKTVPDILRRWRDAVLEDVAADPFTDEEAGQRRAGDDPTIAYGSTLLLAVAVGPALVLAQIGDGDVVGVRADGGAVLPVPLDPQLDGMVTTSLCSASAESDFRAVAIDLNLQPLLAVLLATDGYGNAQLADPWAGAFSRDLARMVAVHDDRWLSSQLPGWAAMCASADGSADDTTVALLLTPASEHRTSGGPAAGSASPPDEEITLPTGYYVQTVPSAQRPPGLETADPEQTDQATIERDAPGQSRRPGEK